MRKRTIVLAAIGTALIAGGVAVAATSPAQPPAQAGPAITTPAAIQPSPPAPAAPSLTGPQKQIAVAAAGYLTDGQGFSEAGLFDQLTSHAGDGFPKHLARWLLARVDASGAVSWDHQALLAARGYLKSGQGFSCAGLIAQLDSRYGDQFTHAQAARAAHRAGAC